MTVEAIKNKTNKRQKLRLVLYRQWEIFFKCILEVTGMIITLAARCKKKKENILRHHSCK